MNGGSIPSNLSLSMNKNNIENKENFLDKMKFDDLILTKENKNLNINYQELNLKIKTLKKIVVLFHLKVLQRFKNETLFEDFIELSQKD